jgi:SAM-dependent methyltransferase
MFKEELELFQRSRGTIWTDEYISKILLAAHLDESSDGASRTKDSRIRVINWINNKIGNNSKIIDLGCGPGLYSYELGKIGHKVFGIDFNKESINYAKTNKYIKNYVEYKYGNYLLEDFGVDHDAALMLYCDFGALIPDEQKELLEKIRNGLSDKGLFIFDVFGKDFRKNKKEYNNWSISKGNDFWNKEPYILLEEQKLFDNENAIGRRYYTIEQETGKIKEYILWDQYYDENTIKEVLENNKFRVKEINKDIIKDEDGIMFIIAEKY